MAVQFTRSSSNSYFRVSVKLPFLSMNPGLNARQTAASFRSVQVEWTVLPHR